MRRTSSGIRGVFAWFGLGLLAISAAAAFAENPAAASAARADSAARPASVARPDSAAAPAALLPASGFKVVDKPLDEGQSLRISFGRSPSDHAVPGRTYSYEILRRSPGKADFDSIRVVTTPLPGGRFSYDDSGLKPGQPYDYVVRVLAPDGSTADTPPSPPVRPARQWFFTNKKNTLGATILFLIVILGTIRAARKGRKLFLRRIAGLDAIDEAVGRCTEMGRPTLYLPGMSTIQDVATIASVNILGQVARKIASYQARLIVPNRDAIVFPVTQDVVREAFVETGYAQNYNPDDVYFVTSDQFAYAAAVCGTMVREKPGAILLLGMFYAESLVLAETGASTGAIQIAGTDAINQLPFFVTACDYTIIGEELYAASAYIGREPSLLGSVKGQDLYKLICILVIIAGVLAMTVGVLVRGEPYDWIGRLLRSQGAS